MCEKNRVPVHDSIPFISFLTCAPGDERARSTCARGLTYEWDDLKAEDRTSLFSERYKKDWKKFSPFIVCNPSFFSLEINFRNLEKTSRLVRIDSTCTRYICRTVCVHAYTYVHRLHVRVYNMYIRNKYVIYNIERDRYIGVCVYIYICM